MWIDGYADKYQKINGFKIRVKTSETEELEGFMSLEPSTRSTYDIAMRDATIDGLVTMDNIEELKAVSSNMREKSSFITIGKELRLTPAKAKRTYEMYYHKQVLELVKALLDKVEGDKEKKAVWEYCFRGHRSAKKRYDMLTKEQNLPEHLSEEVIF